MLSLVLAVTLEIAMAKPPEPLEEILPQTTVILDAVVVTVDGEDKPKAPDAAEVPRQVVTLEVTRLVKGALPSPPGLGPAGAPAKDKRVQVVKPPGAYKLRAGVKGAWLLRFDAKSKELVVLGRYGPDSWPLEKVEQKLGELAPAHLR